LTARIAGLARAAAVLLALAAPVAAARQAIESGPFVPGSFRGLDQALATCSGAQPSFLCHYEDGELTRVPTKGADFFFTPAGELAAAFVKMTRGQEQNQYDVTAGTNVIPFDATAPGGALLVNGDYLLPEDVRGEWVNTDDTTLTGTFTYRAGDLLVERTVVLTSVSETVEHTLVVTRAGGEEAEAGDLLLQVAAPGIARTANPVVKVGYGETFALNPGERPFGDVTYVSLQKANNNRDQAIILLPRDTGVELEGTFVRPNFGVLQATLPATEQAATLAVNLYAGPNELVRYTQEGYLDLPGLFNPNILGQLSLLVVRLLQFIHEYVPSWGLSIIVLTLLFRALIWPLISTQTKSMFGMQALQPKLQELQKKYKDDREKLTQETMKLYREAGVNPAGGCLPILVQMPLFLILWRVFVNFEFAEGFLWIPDLGRADPTFILPILYVAVMVAMSYFSSRSNPQMMRQSMIINVVFGFIIFGFPAGVLLYYVVSMLVQVFQYWLLYRGRPAPAGATPALATGKRGK
jgi:YidC/Oxa1 family membrane protein insertase